MSFDVDHAVDELDHALRLLRDAVRGIPARQRGIVGAHDRLTRVAGQLSVTLTDARNTVT